MPSTTYQDASFGVRNIGSRTDNTGTDYGYDVSAEEDRFAHAAFGEGALTPFDSFVPVSGGAATMDVVFGSGASKADYFIIPGQDAGQGNYLVRLAGASQAVTLGSADPSNPRIDEVYLIVADGAYDGGGVSLPRFGYRQGDAAASPSAPGPDTGWDAYSLLATINVPAGAADIVACTITDERAFSGLFLSGSQRFGVNSFGNTIVEAPVGEGVDFRIDGVTKARITSAGLDLQTSTITNVGTVDGVDLPAHAHTGADGSAVISHDDLGDLGTGDPHPQYLLESGFTKAAIDALNVDADTLDGNDSSYFATAGHNHTGVYLPIAGTAASATKLATARSIALSGDVTGSANFDGSANVTISAAVGNDSHTHDGRYYTESEANGRYYGPSSSAGRKLTISTSGPSGGSNGDIWLEY